jgi:hypothetical protein
MKARPAVAVALLLTFPASVFAQTPRLDLKSIKIASEDSARKPVSLPVVVVRHPFQQAAAPTMPCAESEARGRTDADARPMSKGWFWGSVGAGAAVGIFAVAGAPAVAATVKPKPKNIPAGADAACYTQGFGGKARHEHVLAALWGSLVGLGAYIAIYAIAGQSD